jgi:hypothetical protein
MLGMIVISLDKSVRKGRDSLSEKFHSRGLCRAQCSGGARGRKCEIRFGADASLKVAGKECSAQTVGQSLTPIRCDRFSCLIAS